MTFDENIKKTISLLKENSYIHLAEKLNEYYVGYKSDLKNDEFLNEIIGMCHPKSLGDLSMKTISLKGWWKILSKLENKTKRLINIT